MNDYNLYHNDCLEHLKTMEDNSIDSIVTDPPYGLGKEPNIIEVMKSWINTGYHEIQGTGFMGKEWDSFVPQPIIWKEVFRVLKPGGHILCFSSTRTFDWMSMSLRFAGFEIRDTIAWVYGSGFPKSLNIGKAVDEIQGNERIEISRGGRCGVFAHSGKGIVQNINDYETIKTKGNTEWEGWGTALKPALEPIILARKPLSENTIVENVLRWGTGGINIDDCRIDLEQSESGVNVKPEYIPNNKNNVYGKSMGGGDTPLLNKGRFPANFIHDGSDEVIQNFPYTKSGALFESNLTKDKTDKIYGKFNKNTMSKKDGYEKDEGSASRFFYCAKPSQAERNLGVYHLNFVRHSDRNKEDGMGGDNPRNRSNNLKQNFHPTVKPLQLMRYLCKLITPKNGVILDPFMGSCTTGMSAILENFNFVGIEKEKEYFELSEKRIEYVKNNKKQFDFFEEKKEKNVIKKIKEKESNVVDFIF